LQTSIIALPFLRIKTKHKYIIQLAGAITVPLSKTARRRAGEIRDFTPAAGRDRKNGPERSFIGLSRAAETAQKTNGIILFDFSRVLPSLR
jgi:hypothetical protein